MAASRLIDQAPSSPSEATSEARSVIPQGTVCRDLRCLEQIRTQSLQIALIDILERMNYTTVLAWSNSKSQLQTLEAFNEPWYRLGQMISRLEQLCEQRLFGPQAAAQFVRGFLLEVNYDCFLHDIGYCMEYVDDAPLAVRVRRVNWHT